MKNAFDPTTRFGQDPADTDALVRCWRETSIETNSENWSTFWERTQRFAERPNPEPVGRIMSTKSLWVLATAAAAALVVSSTLSPPWESGTISSNDHAVASVTGKDESSTTDPAPAQVSIDIEENDELAVIRLDDGQCPSEHPCMERVESYVTGETTGTALASNFILFNELESLASE